MEEAAVKNINGTGFIYCSVILTLDQNLFKNSKNSKK